MDIGNNRAMDKIKVHALISLLDDPSEVVIDEVAGQMIAFSITYIIGLKYNYSSFYIMYIFPILLFRFFDITKPFFIGYIDKKIHGGFGIVADDLVSGLIAGLLNFLFIILL